ncbi:sulfatase-like hydrolase/transferase [Verrucomicrobium spinosum]|uniref:sulfatase-like hydrolase/transferase n=1 Tax=Verrucomicrobium spinosum TaxID=2736 RepID=UPI0018DE82BF|nr:sulfatase-like hydrolase/transferase [Verrucomicrobium spinosum]
MPNFPPYTWIKDDRVATPPTAPFVANPKPEEGSAEARPGPMAEGWRLDAVMPTLTKTAVDWIASQKGSDKPFFLYFPWTSPHAPIVPTPEWKGRTQAGPYGDYMAQSDWTAGEVLKALKENGFAENTIVIFSADNGPEHFAYDRAREKGHRSMGEFRGLKRDLWEGGHRVPFTVRWPRVVPKGSVSDGLLSQTDLFATLATAIGAKLPPQSAPDSFNQLELWKGTGSSTRPSMVHNTSKGSYAIRRGTWTLVDAPSGAGTRVPKGWDEANGIDADDQPAALYDMRTDPGQKHNLLTQHPDVVAALRQEFRQIQESGRSRPAPTE